MSSLSSILQQVYIDLGQADIFDATGGSATTTINTNWSDEHTPPSPDYFINHYLFVRRDAGGAGAAPEGKWARITNYTFDTQTITHATVTTAIASGDTMLLAKQSTFPITDVVAAVNNGLRRIGVFTFSDTTSIVIAADKTEYSLPSAALEVLDVLIQTNDDANDNTWKSIAGWKIIPATSAMSSEPLLYIPQQATGYDIMLVYRGYHPSVTAYDSAIYKFIRDELVIAATKVCLLESRINFDSSPVWASMYAEALRQYNEGRVMLPTISIAKRKKHGLRWQAYSEE